MDVHAAAGTPVPNEYIIGFKQGTSPAQRAAALKSIAPQTVEPLGLINGALVRMGPQQPGLGNDRLRLPVGLDGVVKFVQPNHYLELRRGAADDAVLGAATSPAPGGTGIGSSAGSSAGSSTSSSTSTAAAPTIDDPEFPKQYHLQNTGQTGGTPGADVKATAAWPSSTGAGVVVAVADTNLDIEHPDLKPNIWVNPGEVAGNGKDDDANGYVDDVNGWNFGRNSNRPQDGGDSHGTHVAGIIGAVAANATGGAGVAPNVKLMPLAMLTGGNTTANAIKAFDYAIRNGANIISNSWGNNRYEPALQEAVTQATDAGVMVVVASGNENWDTGVNGSYPDNYAGSVSIAASDARDARASYSNRGIMTVDMAAPGDKVHSTLPYRRYGAMSGTSMAAPTYSGIAALVKARYPHLTMQQVEDRIFRSVQRDGSAAGWNGLVASGGRADAEAALMPIATPVDPGPVARAVPTVGAPVRLGWQADVTDGQRFHVEVSTNADATAAVEERFDGGAATRAFRSDGDVQWAVKPGTGVDGTAAMAIDKLGSGKVGRLELTETITEPTELSFRYKAARGGNLSFFVDRNLQAEPATGDGWQEFRTTLQPGTRTLTWLATGKGSTGGPMAIDELRIGKVSDATWSPVATTEPGQTEVEWAPEGPVQAAQVRVRPDNGRWQGDWVAGPRFSVEQ